MSQSYHCMRHSITTMSQTLTKPAWPEATTCVTAAGWKYRSVIPLPPLYFGMTKSQCAGRAQNYKTSVASHIMVLHFLSFTPTPFYTTFFHPCFCQKPMIKCTCLDLYSSIVPRRRFHFTTPPPPPPLRPLFLCLPSLPPFFSVTVHISVSIGHWVNVCIFSARRGEIQTFADV